MFGANRARLEAAGAGLEATTFDRDRTQLVLAAEIARNYVRLRASQQQYAITLQNLRIQQETLKITQGQRDEGAVSDLDVVRAQAQVNGTMARLPQIRTASVSFINRLNVLTGHAPGTLDEVLNKVRMIPSMPPALVIATPVAVIAQRPDVSVAERRLAQATALSAAAIADFYPKLSLQGFFGVQHSQLYGVTSPWSATVTALLPLLNFGKLSSQADAADARKEQALYVYQQTILLALEEAENSLSGYLSELNRRKSLQLVAAQQAKAADIAREQYKAGIAAQIDLLVAERNRLDADNDVILSQQQVAENLILLYRSLGASWKEEDKPKPTE